MDWIRPLSILLVFIYGFASAFYDLPDYVFPVLFVLWIIAIIKFGGTGGEYSDYFRIEKWIKVNYGIDVKDKAKSGRLYELDMVYSKELGKRIPEKRLIGLQAYIRTQKNKKMIR